MQLIYFIKSIKIYVEINVNKYNEMQEIKIYRFIIFFRTKEKSLR